MSRPRIRTVLFVCSRNRLRSPTAEQVFSRREDLEVASAGTDHDADNPLSAELVEWADVMLVMEKTHRGKLQRRFEIDASCRFWPPAYRNRPERRSRGENSPWAR